MFVMSFIVPSGFGSTSLVFVICYIMFFFNFLSLAIFHVHRHLFMLPWYTDTFSTIQHLLMLPWPPSALGHPQRCVAFPLLGYATLLLLLFHLLLRFVRFGFVSRPLAFVSILFVSRPLAFVRFGFVCNVIIFERCPIILVVQNEATAFPGLWQHLVVGLLLDKVRIIRNRWRRLGKRWLRPWHLLGRRWLHRISRRSQRPLSRWRRRCPVSGKDLVLASFAIACNEGFFLGVLVGVPTPRVLATPVTPPIREAIAPPTLHRHRAETTKKPSQMLKAKLH